MTFLILLLSVVSAQDIADAQSAMNSFIQNPTISSLSSQLSVQTDAGARSSISQEINGMIESFVMTYSVPGEETYSQEQTITVSTTPATAAAATATDIDTGAAVSTDPASTTLSSVESSLVVSDSFSDSVATTTFSIAGSSLATSSSSSSSASSSSSSNAGATTIYIAGSPLVVTPSASTSSSTLSGSSILSGLAVNTLSPQVGTPLAFTPSTLSNSFGTTKSSAGAPSLASTATLRSPEFLTGIQDITASFTGSSLFVSGFPDTTISLVAPPPVFTAGLSEAASGDPVGVTLPSIDPSLFVTSTPSGVSPTVSGKTPDPSTTQTNVNTITAVNSIIASRRSQFISWISAHVSLNGAATSRPTNMNQCPMMQYMHSWASTATNDAEKSARFNHLSFISSIFSREIISAGQTVDVTVSLDATPTADTVPLTAIPTSSPSTASTSVATTSSANIVRRADSVSGPEPSNTLRSELPSPPLSPLPSRNTNDVPAHDPSFGTLILPSGSFEHPHEHFTHHFVERPTGNFSREDFPLPTGAFPPVPQRSRTDGTVTLPSMPGGAKLKRDDSTDADMQSVLSDSQLQSLTQLFITATDSSVESAAASSINSVFALLQEKYETQLARRDAEMATPSVGGDSSIAASSSSTVDSAISVPTDDGLTAIFSNSDLQSLSQLFMTATDSAVEQSAASSINDVFASLNNAYTAPVSNTPSTTADVGATASTTGGGSSTDSGTSSDSGLSPTSVETDGSDSSSSASATELATTAATTSETSSTNAQADAATSSSSNTDLIESSATDATATTTSSTAAASAAALSTQFATGSLETSTAADPGADTSAVTTFGVPASDSGSVDASSTGSAVTTFSAPASNLVSVNSSSTVDAATATTGVATTFGVPSADINANASMASSSSAATGAPFLVNGTSNGSSSNSNGTVAGVNATSTAGSGEAAPSLIEVSSTGGLPSTNISGNSSTSANILPNGSRTLSVFTGSAIFCLAALII